MSSDLREVAAECGRGGIRCRCCGDPPGSRARRQTFRRARRREKARDLREREAELEEVSDG